MNRVKQLFDIHKVSIGTLTHLRSMTAIESLGSTGLDYVVIDQEHSPVSDS